MRRGGVLERPPERAAVQHDGDPLATLRQHRPDASRRVDQLAAPDLAIFASSARDSQVPDDEARDFDAVAGAGDDGVTDRCQLLLLPALNTPPLSDNPGARKKPRRAAGASSEALQPV